MVPVWLLFAGCGNPDPLVPPDSTAPDSIPSDTADDPVVDPPVWTDAPLPVLIHGWSFHVDAVTAGPAEVRCTLVDDPLEVHTVRATDDVPVHDLVVYGLLASATYDCALEMAGTTVDRSITTRPIADGFPTWTTTGDGGEGYTLLNGGTDLRWNRQSKLLIVDQQGRLRWSYEVPYSAADLDAQYLGDGRILYGGGYSAPPTIIDLSGVTIAAAPASSTGFDYHHHAQRIATGEIVTLTEGITNDGVSEWWVGFAIDILDPELVGRTWTWNSQSGYDAGWLPPATPVEIDAYHANSVQVDGDDLYMNLRQLSRLVKLDRVTGERLWTLGPGQDFELVDANGVPDDPANWFYMPHAPEKDGDRILFYDNGVGRPGGPSSRIVEMVIDENLRTARVVWSYTEPGWYEPIWGDVDRLPNGRVLFVRAHSAVTVPVLSYERTEVVEVDPATDTVTWRMSFTDLHDAGYRAERIDGCAVFANAATCR